MHTFGVLYSITSQRYMAVAYAVVYASNPNAKYLLTGLVHAVDRFLVVTGGLEKECMRIYCTLNIPLNTKRDLIVRAYITNPTIGIKAPVFISSNTELITKHRQA
jgi:hypothetical protein